MRLCVLLPAFNEESTIRGLIKEIRLFVKDVIVVDDGSLDSTAKLANEEKVHVISHKERAGKGVALRSGFEYVLKNNFDAVITMDGDFQHDPSELCKFIRCAEASSGDIIIGNRMAEKKGMPLMRRLTNKTMSLILSALIKQHIPDTQCGFRLIRKNVLQNVSLTSMNFEIESEILLKAAQKKFKIESIPINTIYLGRKSHINPFLDTLRFMKFLMKMTIETLL
jgi:glycosyltransferase involved in cell wall biosynthesis